MRNEDRYKSLSRFTDPGNYSALLDRLPEDVAGIAAIAKQLTIHHNLLAYFGVSNANWKTMKRVWPPRMRDVLQALSEIAPGDLNSVRPPEHRIIGACVLESHLLAGLLRHRQIPTRIRAGYFKDVMRDIEHTLIFWENISREKGVQGDLLKEDPDAWKESIDAYTRYQSDINHYIEHWVCEYWDTSAADWRIIDANDTFLKAHSNIDVGYQLPKKHFEYACEAWKKMRSEESVGSGSNFNPDQYAEDPKDGRSHIRSQLLWDYFSLLNHDIAGYDEPSPDVLGFVKERRSDELAPHEIEELDNLATLMSTKPMVEEPVSFYRRSQTLKLESVEQDPYCFIFGEQ